MSTLLIYAVALFVGVFVFGIVALTAFIVSDEDDQLNERRKPHRQ